MLAHKQVKVICDDEELFVDVGMVDLLKAIWQHDIVTVNSCQENFPDTTWIEFLSPDDASKFLNIVAGEHPHKEKRPWLSLYGRIEAFGSNQDWSFNIHPRNEGVIETLLNDEVRYEYLGFNDFKFSVSIRFPIKDIPKLILRLNKLQS